MTPDPIGLKAANVKRPQSLNLYTYVHNDPINLVDPTGEFAYNPPNNGYINYGIDGCLRAGGIWAVTGYDAIGRPVWGCTGGSGGSSLSSSITMGEQRPRSGTTPQVQRDVLEILKDFFAIHGEKLNQCIATVFGSAATNIPFQSFENAAWIDATLSPAQVGANSRVPSAVGSSRPFEGAFGTVLIANTLFNSTGTNAINAIYGTYAHELANILDMRNGGNGYTYGNPNDPDDPDTGAAVEKCMFGSLQYP